MKILSFGCRLNTFESTVIQKLLADRDDIFVVNTCAVTHEAERQCQQAIRRAARENPDMKIIVTGCAAQLNPQKYANMPEVFKVVGNIEKLSRKCLLEGDRIQVQNILDTDFEVPVITDFESRTRAFLQIQQGCSHACTFCIVRKARGKNKGLPVDQVINEANSFVSNGFSELVLTGVDITSYPYGFNFLLKEILKKVTGLKRLRLGSIDPACMDDEFVDIVASNPVFMPHLHLSMQSGDNMILKRMGRRHSFEQVLKMCQKLKEQRPNFVFGADFITGFPTETEEMFLNTVRFVQEAGITHLHVFPYSVRPETPAAKMPMVEMCERKRRAALLREVGQELLTSCLDKQIGKTLSVLVETQGVGYTENYLKVKTNCEKTGEIIPVLITGREKNELVGEA
ncbi:MAG: tRNA (N(6)-L-threonylcarbamoyladenosine(37)-C(2))-methylthiotransferase MtaB [Alphaproteobacteria bacterium]|nr:tRNA (N(6)-L-threonylcarbamoyladenosine(37)-C(2))-methylthiotransferase MtaB [Alphaproteobacteria bacterium]